MMKNDLNILIIVIFLFTSILVIPVYAESQKLNLASYSGGTNISEINANPVNYVNENVKVTGKITEVVNVQTPPSYTTYMKLDDGTGSLWAATQADDPLNIQNGIELTVNGFLMINFRSNSTGITYDLIIFTRPDELIFPTTPIQTSNQIQIDMQMKELEERLNQTEARQNQQEKRLSWLEEKMNVILQWLRSMVGI